MGDTDKAVAVCAALPGLSPMMCWLFGPRYKRDVHFAHRCVYCGRGRAHHGRHRWWWAR